MKIVGVGVGPGMITGEAIEAIRQAEVIYGARRAIELAWEHINCEYNLIEDYTKIHELPGYAVVLSTGDPNLSGLGKYACSGDIVIPGISSFQVACARLYIDMTEIKMITAHGRNPTLVAVKFRPAIASGSTVFLLPSKDFGIKEVVSTLLSIGLDVPIAVLEQLGYPDEHVEVGTSHIPPTVNSGLYCMVVGPAIRSGVD